MAKGGGLGLPSALRKKSQQLPPPIHPIDESEPLDVAKIDTEVKMKATFPGEGEKTETPEGAMATLTKAILVLPTLIHHATQSHKKFPTDPTGAGKMTYGGDWVHPVESKVDGYGGKLDALLYNVTPWVYITMWTILTVMYFVVPGGSA